MSPGGRLIVTIEKGTQMIFAYLDPGSGSLILQAVLGGVAGLGVAAKAMRNRWRSRSGSDESASEDESTPEQVPTDQPEG